MLPFNELLPIGIINDRLNVLIVILLYNSNCYDMYLDDFLKTYSLARKDNCYFLEPLRFLL